MTDDEIDQQMMLWTHTGYINSALPAEAKSIMRGVEYDMHLEDKAYTALFTHLVEAHGMEDWQIHGAETWAVNGGPEFTITSHHAKLHETFEGEHP